MPLDLLLLEGLVLFCFCMCLRGLSHSFFCIVVFSPLFQGREFRAIGHFSIVTAFTVADKGNFSTFFLCPSS